MKTIWNLLLLDDGVENRETALSFEDEFIQNSFIVQGIKQTVKKDFFSASPTLQDMLPSYNKNRTQRSSVISNPIGPAAFESQILDCIQLDSIAGKILRISTKKSV